MDALEKLESKLVRCCEELVNCSGIISEFETVPKRKNIQKIGKALAEIGDLRSVIYESRPDLKPQGWGEDPTEFQYAEMFEEAIRQAEEYLIEGKSEKAIETYEKYIFIGPVSKYKKLAEQKIIDLRKTNNL